MSAPPSGSEVERRDLLKAIELGFNARASSAILPRRSLVLFVSTGQEEISFSILERGQ